MPAKEKLVLREGAPDEVKQWFSEISDHATAYRADLVQRIADAESELKEIRSRRVGSVNVGMAGSETDQAALRQKGRDYKAQSELIQKFKVDLKRFDAEPLEVAYWKAASTIPVLNHFSVGTWGTLPQSMRVSQIVDDNQLIVRVGDDRVWLSGFDTSNVVDDQQITYDRTVIVSRTKHYRSVLGATITCWQVEPFPVREYVTIEGGH